MESKGREEEKGRNKRKQEYGNTGIKEGGVEGDKGRREIEVKEARKKGRKERENWRLIIGWIRKWIGG